MSPINPSLAHIYCSNLVSKYDLIRLIRFVSRFTVHLCNAIYFLIIFSTPYKWFIKILCFVFGSKQAFTSAWDWDWGTGTVGGRCRLPTARAAAAFPSAEYSIPTHITIHSCRASEHVGTRLTHQLLFPLELLLGAVCLVSVQQLIRC